MATEEDFATRVPGCEVGAMPPFGNLWGIPVFVSDGFRPTDAIAFEAGSHSELLEMAYVEFERLATPRVGHFARYYRSPTISGDQIAFIAEGDVFVAPRQGGQAVRLTTHPGVESDPQFSPSGEEIAFVGKRHGMSDVYTIRATGGSWSRRTWSGTVEAVVGWDTSGNVMYRSRGPRPHLWTQISSGSDRGRIETIPLARAFGAVHGDGGLFFTRPGRQGSQTHRYLDSLGAGRIRKAQFLNQQGDVVAFGDGVDGELNLYRFAASDPAKAERIGALGAGHRSNPVPLPGIGASGLRVIHLYDSQTDQKGPITSDRLDSHSPCFSPDG